MDLTQISALGLPLWVFVLVVVLVVLNQIGLFRVAREWLFQRTQFEYEQQEARAAAEQSEQVAMWSQMTQLQTMALQQNELLLEFIIDESKNWHKGHRELLQELAERQQTFVYELKTMQTKFTIMVGVIEQNYGKKTTDNG